MQPLDASYCIVRVIPTLTLNSFEEKDMTDKPKMTNRKRSTLQLKQALKYEADAEIAPDDKRDDLVARSEDWFEKACRSENMAVANNESYED